MKTYEGVGPPLNTNSEINYFDKTPEHSRGGIILKVRCDSFATQNYLTLFEQHVFGYEIANLEILHLCKYDSNLNPSR